jgi:uncharacterized protein (UPF0332 family)
MLSPYYKSRDIAQRIRMARYSDYLAKARQSLLGAQSELEQKRFDNTVNRAYYACFQAAVAALIAADVPVLTEKGGTVSHQVIHSGFSNLLIRRRKLYPAFLRGALQDVMRDRIAADYGATSVSAAVAGVDVRRAQAFVDELVRRLPED